MPSPFDAAREHFADMYRPAGTIVPSSSAAPPEPTSGVSAVLRSLASGLVVPSRTPAPAPADAAPAVDHVREALRAQRREELAAEVAAAKAAREAARERWVRTTPVHRGYSHHQAGAL